MEIYWQHYYDTLWQAIATITIHGICSLLLFLILMNTICRFFIKCKCNMSNKANRKRTKSNVVDASIPRLELQVSNSNTMDINDSIDGRTSTISTVSYSRKSTLRSVDEYRGKSVEIAMSIKILTLFYLLLIFLFSFISFIMRILMVFYDYKIDCLIREHSIEIALLGRICLFIIFSYRLYFSFKETSLAYPTPYLILFTLIGFIITNSTLIYFFMQIAKNRDYNTSNYACTKPGFSTTKAILPYFLCEFTFNGILVFLFCRKLIQSVRLLLHLSGGGVQMNFQVLQTMKLLSKMTLLMSVIFISTLLILSLMTSYLSSACVSLDNLFNVICMLLVFKHNERYYNSFCCLCNKMCVRFCLCFCLNGINTMSDINHKEEDIDMIMERKIPLDIITESTEETICTDNDDNRKLSDDNSNEVNSKESSPENHSLSDESPISPNQSYNDYTNALAVIFLNESNPNSRFDEAQVPMFID